MADDYRRRVQDAQSGFEKVAGSIPGYKGYKERELRREADKLLRTHLARRFDAQRERLVNVMAELTEGGRLDQTLALERANLRLQLLVDRLRTASYGYTGLFDALKVQQAQLDALYDHDRTLVGGVDRVAELVGTIEGQAAAGESPAAEAKALLGVLQELNDTFGRRMEAIAGE